MAEPWQISNLIKVQIGVAVIAATVTLVAAFQLAPSRLLEAKQELQSELIALEERKKETEASLNRLIAKLKIAGIYEGEVEDGLQSLPITTTIILQSDGEVAGIYVIDEHGRGSSKPRIAGGRLSDFSFSHPITASFNWRDEYGFVALQIRFSPDY